MDDIDPGAIIANARKRNKTEEAVLYILRRIQTDPNVRYYLGPGSQAMYLLCQAEAEITGEPLELIERERSKFLRPHDDVPDIVKYKKRIRKLEEGDVDGPEDD